MKSMARMESQPRVKGSPFELDIRIKRN